MPGDIFAFIFRIKKKPGLAVPEGFFKVLDDQADIRNQHPLDFIKSSTSSLVDISALRARQVVRDDFKDFDLIIALDQSHLRALSSGRRK